jgi:hypothetical protein
VFEVVTVLMVVEVEDPGEESPLASVAIRARALRLLDGRGEGVGDMGDCAGGVADEVDERRGLRRGPLEVAVPLNTKFESLRRPSKVSCGELSSAVSDVMV